MPHRYVLAVVSLVVLMAVVGCHRKPTYTPPDTYPVSGKVVAVVRELPVNGTVRFIPDDPNHISQGMIQQDGTFELKVLFHEEWVPGAKAGPHKVEILVPIGAGRQGGQTITLDEVYTVEPKENNFTITLNKQ